MGALSNVPFLAGYNEQDQINRASESQGLMRLSQLMQMQKMKQELQQAPEDRAMKARLANAQISQYEGNAAENQAKAKKMQDLFLLAKDIAATPEGNPDRAQKVLQYRMLADPTQVFDPEKQPTQFGKIAPNDYTPASIATFMKTKNYGDLVAAAKPSTHVNVAAPVTPVTIQDPKDPNATIVIDGRTRQVLGAGPKLSQVGSVQQKLVTNLPQAKLRTESMVQNLDKLDTAMTTLYDDPNLSRITGTVAGRTPNITNAATGAQTDLDSIKSSIFQAALQAMREASKTGGAVGNVSDREGDKLERTLAGLDQAAGTPKFKENLKKAVEQVRLSKQLIQNAFDEQYGEIGQPTGAAAPDQTTQPKRIKFDARGNMVK